MNDMLMLEFKLEVNETMTEFLEEQLAMYRKEHERLTWELNRARRIERELHNATRTD